MPEYHGIWQNMAEYHDIFPEYTEIRYNDLKMQAEVRRIATKAHRREIS
jgi:hypothetical protein